MIGCQTYTQSQLIAIMRHSSRDKTYAIAQQLIAAKLNILCGHANSSCIASAVAAADAWLCAHPIGSNPKNSVWNQISGVNDTLTTYNEGHMCAPHCGAAQ